MEEFFARLKEHKLVQWTLGYAAVAVALLPVLDIVASQFGWPESLRRGITLAVIMGFFFVLVLAWYHGERAAQKMPRSEVLLLVGLVAITGVLMWRVAPSGHESVPAVSTTKVTLTAQPPAQASAATSARADIPPNSIAVLPFTNESSDKEQNYFADGIAEDLLNLLTRVQPLRVAARTSSFGFQGKGLGIPEIAAKLHVANVLEGSVFKQGDEVRVSAQLVRASDGYQIWSHSYDRKLTDIFAIQDGIAADVVKNLRIKLLGAVPTLRTTDPKAYALYLQARQLASQNTADAFKSSNALLQQALAIDPRYVPAWVRLSGNLADETVIGVLPPDQGLRQAIAAANKALAIDPDDAPVQSLLGLLAAAQKNDLPGAARHLQSALALDPTNPSVLGASAELLQALGRLPQAIAVAEYQVARDPVNPLAFSNLGNSYLSAGRYDEAIAALHTTLSLSPGFSGAHAFLGAALLLKGDAQAALVQFQQEKDPDGHMQGVALVDQALGLKAKADAALAAYIARYTKDDPEGIAQLYAYRGEADPAFAWLDKAIKVPGAILFDISSDPLLAKLHADPRWLPFLRKIGYAPEQTAKIAFTVTLPGATRPARAISAASAPLVPASAESTGQP